MLNNSSVQIMGEFNQKQSLVERQIIVSYLTGFKVYCILKTEDSLNVLTQKGVALWYAPPCSVSDWLARDATHPV